MYEFVQRYWLELTSGVIWLAFVIWIAYPLVITPLRRSKSDKIKQDRGSEQKCPGCKRWESEMTTPMAWHDTGAAEVIMSCECGHKSTWILGPGIWLCTDPVTPETREVANVR